MKGLLIKDFLNVKEIYKTNFMMLAVFIVLGIITKNIFYVTTMLLILGVNQTLTTMSYDQKNNWLQYSIAMPISKNKIVKEKYIFAIINILASGIIAFLISYFAIYLRSDIEFLELVFSILSNFIIVILMLAILVPVIYKYGIEKTRIVMMGIIIVPVFLILGIVYLVPKPVGLDIEKLMLVVLGALSVLSILAFFLSIRISTRIIKNKDF